MGNEYGYKKKDTELSTSEDIELTPKPEYTVKDAAVVTASNLKEKKIPSASGVKDVRYSGVCGKCRKRFTAVPVIDGVPQCPRCDSL